MKDSDQQAEVVWKALADGTRRAMLDRLAERPQLTGELVEHFDQLCRTNVMKHLGILVDAGLVVIRRQGRQRWNYLNPVPIQQICDRWVSQHVQGLASAVARLKTHVEDDSGPGITQAQQTGRRKDRSTSKRQQSSAKRKARKT